MKLDEVYCEMHSTVKKAYISELCCAHSVHTMYTLCTLSVHTGCTPAEGLRWIKNTCLSVSHVDSLVQAACIARI
jgi:hypothetical protein